PADDGGRVQRLDEPAPAAHSPHRSPAAPAEHRASRPGDPGRQPVARAVASGSWRRWQNPTVPTPTVTDVLDRARAVVDSGRGLDADDVLACLQLPDDAIPE